MATNCIEIEYKGFKQVLLPINAEELTSSRVIKNCWLIVMADSQLLLQPAYDQMAGLNNHTKIKNPELIYLANLQTAASGLLDELQRNYDHRPQSIHYGNLNVIVDADKAQLDIELLCGYYNANIKGE